MSIYKFTEVLNDTINYFLLGDLATLKRCKLEKGLSDDLEKEFITTENGDNVVKNGMVIPLVGIENYPYTVLFSFSKDTPELRREGSDLQVEEKGYYLKIESNKLLLFTWWILQNFTDEKIE